MVSKESYIIYIVIGMWFIGICFGALVMSDNFWMETFVTIIGISISSCLLLLVYNLKGYEIVIKKKQTKVL